MKILVIDDNAVNLAAIEQALQDQHEVIPMISGKRAIKYLSRKEADLILLDVQMPVMNGVQTLREIRQLEYGSSVPVMFLSATEDEEAITEGYRLGIIDYIRKPIDEAGLKKRIEQMSR